MDGILYVGRHDLIICANFGDDRLGSWRGGGQVLLFCLYIRRRPYKHITTTVMSVDVTSLRLKVLCR